MDEWLLIASIWCHYDGFFFSEEKQSNESTALKLLKDNLNPV